MPIVSTYSPAHGRSRDLLWTLIRTDFKSRYHGTIGGFLWALLKPFAMFLVLLAVFSFVFASDPEYKFDLIIGLFLYDFFTEATKVGLTSLYTKGYLLSKARFPTWIVVVASASNAVITLAIFVLVITVFRSITVRPPTALEFGFFLLYLAAFIVIVIGFSLASSVLFLRYRDLNQVWDVAIQAGFFLAPVIYPLRIIPEQYQAYLYVWPPTVMIEFSRAVLADGTVPTWRAHQLLFVETAAVLAIGVLVFRRYSPRAAEYL